MRKHGRTDANHSAIVDGLRRFGVRVLSLAAMGNGCPDLLVAYRGVLCLLEVKDSDKPPSARALTAAELEFIASWTRAYVVTTLDEAIGAVVEAARPAACERYHPTDDPGVRATPCAPPTSCADRGEPRG